MNPSLKRTTSDLNNNSEELDMSIYNSSPVLKRMYDLYIDEEKLQEEIEELRNEESKNKESASPKKATSDKKLTKIIIRSKKINIKTLFDIIMLSIVSFIDKKLSILKFNRR